MLVVLERMFFDRGVVKLEDAYCPRERETTELITRRGRMEVVSTSMLIYGFEAECAARTDWRRPVTARKGAEAVGDGSPGGGRRGLASLFFNSQPLSFDGLGQQPRLLRSRIDLRHFPFLRLGRQTDAPEVAVFLFSIHNHSSGFLLAKNIFQEEIRKK